MYEDVNRITKKWDKKIKSLCNTFKNDQLKQ